MKLTREKLIRQFVAANKQVVSLTLLSSFLSSMGSVLLPLSIGIYYQLAFQENTGKSELLRNAGITLTDLQGFFLFFGGLTLVKAIMAWCENIGMRTIEERFTRHIRKLLFHAQLNHEFSAFQSKPVGKYVLRYSSDMLAIQYYLSKGIIKSISDGAFLLAAFGLLFSINRTLSVALVIIFLSGAAIMLLLSRLQEEPNENRRNARSSLIGFIEQRLQAFATIKAFNRAHPEELKFEKRNNAFYTKSIRFHAVSALHKSIPQFIFFAAIGILLFLALPKSASSPASDGSLLVFILMLLYLQSVYKRLLRVPAILNAGATSFKNLLAMLNQEHEVMHTAHAPSAKEPLNIRLDSVSFRFNEDQAILTTISAQFRSGQIHRIEGASGSGKSTLLKLLIKLYRPTSGTICLNNQNIGQIGAHDLRKLITTVSEDFPLLGKTIFEAISYSRNEAKKADTARMVVRLGLCTEENSEHYLMRRIQPFGSDLSSSERKMLQFARSLLTRKPILMLDEPFTNLTESAQDVICSELMTLKEKKLILIVANTIPSPLTIDQTFSL